MTTQFLFSVATAVVVLSIFIWMLIPSGNSKLQTDENGNELLDPNDARQLGTLFGMYGMDVVDASIAKFAIERFKATYGRPPTTLDVGIIVGIMRENQSM